MTHYVKSISTEPFELFGGTVTLSFEDRMSLSDAQFLHPSVTAAITAGKLVETNQLDYVKRGGEYPVTNTDKQLVRNENTSVDTELGAVHIHLYPRPQKGCKHVISPAEPAWETNHVYLHSDLPITGKSDPTPDDSLPYVLDISVTVLIIYVGDEDGWRVMPQS